MFRKFAKTLDLGFRVQPLDLGSRPDVQKLEKASNTYYIPEWVLRECNTKFGQDLKGKTWGEAKMVAKEGALCYLREQQDRHAGILGCFRTMLEQPEFVKRPGNTVDDLIPESTIVDNYGYDIVSLAIWDGSILHAPQKTAALVFKPNSCIFYPCFFSHLFVDSLKDMRIIPGITSVQELLDQPRGRVLIHELTHVEHVKDAIDARIYEHQLRRLNRALWPKSNAFKYCPGPGYAAYWIAYTRELWKILALLNPEGAEKNAETYATHNTLKVLQLMYPEYGFSGEYVTFRDELLHHFSGLDILRHPDAGSIRSLKVPAHDPKKDTFRRIFGNWVPGSIETLVEELIKWIESKQW